MRLFLGFDDTDTEDGSYGTGKLVRWLTDKLPKTCIIGGVVRQQLLVDDAIPYTSHNSAACLIADIPDAFVTGAIIETAVAHLEHFALPGSDPGLCVAAEGDSSMAELIAFGHQCTRAVVTQKEARDAARRVHLSGHGGTNDGMIGAAAAVGLTASGWSGRFIEFSNLRAFGEHVSVAELTALGIHTLSIDRDATLPDPLDLVNTKKWVRPRMVAHRPLLLIRPAGDGIWENIDRKNKKRCHGPENSRLKKR